MHTFKKHSFFWVMLILFTGSILSHFIFAWYAHQQQETDYWTTVLRDMLENWQSEFLQLLLQIVLIAYFWFAGSPSSHSEEERIEKKIDFLLEQINPLEAEKLKKDLEKQFPKK